jgi:aspartate/methionine/tyrosine aminotransferase
LKPISKSSKLADVCYDIRGPVLEKARQMEEEVQKIIKLNIGNLAVFGFDPPDESVQDMIRNLPATAGYTDSKGLFAPRKAVVHYTQEKNIPGVTVDDVYLGNGASELIVMALNALLDTGDEILVPAPDYPLWTAAVSLSGGRRARDRGDAPDDGKPNRGVSVVRPKAALYMFPRLDPKLYPIADDQQVAYELLAEEKVLIVQGTGFNWTQPDHFRLVFLPNSDDLAEAVGRIARFLDGYRKRHTR